MGDSMQCTPVLSVDLSTAANGIYIVTSESPARYALVRGWAARDHMIRLPAVPAVVSGATTNFVPVENLDLVLG